MLDEQYKRLLQIIAGQKIQFKTPIGLVMLSAKVKEKEKVFILKLSAKPESEVMSATMGMSIRAGQMHIDTMEGLDALLIKKDGKEVPNPMSSQGVGTFLVNSLLLILQDIFSPNFVVGGVLEKPKFREMEPLAARRDFWRNFGFKVDGTSGRDMVVAKLESLKTFERPLFGSNEMFKGKNLLDQHLM